MKACLRCTDRHPLCHSHCERYQREVEANEAVKAARKAEDFYGGYVKERNKAIKKKLGRVTYGKDDAM